MGGCLTHLEGHRILVGGEAETSQASGTPPPGSGVSLASKNVWELMWVKCRDREPERVSYLGVSYGLTQQLYRFWKKSKFAPIYLRQTQVAFCGNEEQEGPYSHSKQFPSRNNIYQVQRGKNALQQENVCDDILIFFLCQNETTGENSCIMLRPIEASLLTQQQDWLSPFVTGLFPSSFSKENPNFFTVRLQATFCESACIQFLHPSSLPQPW